MKNRTTLVLVAALLALGAVAALVQRPSHRDRPREKALVFPALSPGAVREIHIRGAAGAVGLSRAGDGWAVGPERFSADAAAVTKFLEGLAALREDAIASDNSAKQSLYEVDPAQAIAVKLEGEGGARLAEFFVGKSGADYQSCYLRRQGEDTVALVAMDLRSMLARPVAGWRDRTVAPFGRDELTAVQLETGAAAVVLERGKEGAWLVNGRAAAREPVEGYLDLLATLRAADFAAAAEEGEAGFGTPAAVIRLEAGAKKAVLTLGANKAGSSQSYLRSDQSPAIFLVSRFVADALRKSEAGFPPPPSGKP